MDLSIFLAKLMGIYLLISCFGLIKNRTMLEQLAVDIGEKPYVFFVFGLFDLLLGLLLVLSHNVWTLDWQVLITLVGWIILVRGFLRVLCPEEVANFVTRIKDKLQTIFTIICFGFLLIGVILTYQGFFATH